MINSVKQPTINLSMMIMHISGTMTIRIDGFRRLQIYTTYIYTYTQQQFFAALVYIHSIYLHVLRNLTTFFMKQIELEIQIHYLKPTKQSNALQQYRSEIHSLWFFVPKKDAIYLHEAKIEICVQYFYGLNFNFCVMREI